MTAITALMPRQPAPDQNLDLIGGGRFSLKDTKPTNFTLVVAYRGYHCPICKAYLGKLKRLLPELNERGIDVVAVSARSLVSLETTTTEEQSLHHR